MIKKTDKFKIELLSQINTKHEHKINRVKRNFRPACLPSWDNSVLDSCK